MKKQDIQFIEKNGKPEWAVIPYNLYQSLLRDAEMAADIAAFDKAVSEDNGFRVPSEVVFNIVDGMQPVKAWRLHRKLSQGALAEEAGISKAYLSQIESGKRQGTAVVLKALCKVLKIPVDEVLS